MILVLKEHIHRSCLTFYGSFSSFRKIQGCAGVSVKTLIEVIELSYFLCSVTDWNNEWVLCPGQCPVVFQWQNGFLNLPTGLDITGKKM